MFVVCFCFFFKQKTANEVRISDWSSDLCASDLGPEWRETGVPGPVVRNDDRNGHVVELVGGDVDDHVVSLDPRVGEPVPHPGAVHPRAESLVLISEARRVGKEWVRSCISRWAPYL